MLLFSLYKKISTDISNTFVFSLFAVFFVCINALFILKLRGWDLYQSTEDNTGHLTLTSNFNDSAMVWPTIQGHIITLSPPLSVLLATGTSALDIIDYLAHPSGSSSVTLDSSVKITSIFMYLLSQFIRFKTFL